MRILFLITTLLCCLCTRAQVIVTIKDSASGKNIENVFVSTVRGNLINTVGFTNADGTISIGAEKKQSVFRFDHPSYNTKLIAVTDSFPSIVLLSLSDKNLEPVIVTGCKPEIVKIKSNKHLRQSDVGIAAGNDLIQGAVISIPKTEMSYKIEKLSFYFNLNNVCGKQQALIVYFFKVKNGRPTLEPLMEPLLIPAENIRRVLTVETESDELLDEEEICIALQWQQIKCESMFPSLFWRCLETSANRSTLWTYFPRNKEWKHSSTNGIPNVSLDLKYCR